ncbi:MAG: DUF1993 domain-containing protein [Hyphomicrobiaceae bacterium]
MSLSMYQACVPALVRTLTQLDLILDKAANHARVHNIDPSVLLSARLYPDMFTCARQVQIVTDFCKGASHRLAGRDVPVWADEESTFAELKDRVAKTRALLETFAPADIDGSEDRDITLKLSGMSVKFKGQSYLLQFVLPNVYFHAATAYGILRHNGVELGKMDFIGPLG